MISDAPLCYLQTRRKLELLELTEKLENERKTLEAEVHRLKIIAHNEQADVDNLAAPGLKGFFLGLTGRKQEQMEQEQSEARNAKQNFDTAQTRLYTTKNQLNLYIDELSALGGCEDTLRQLMQFPEDAELKKLTQLLSDISCAQEEISQLKSILTKVSEWGAVRTATAATSALAETDNKLRAIENKAQKTLDLLKEDLIHLQDQASSFGISIDVSELQRVENNYLTDLYTSALIDIRVDKISVKLRQIRFQLDAAYPKLTRIASEKHKAYLQSLLRFAEEQIR